MERRTFPLYKGDSDDEITSAGCPLSPGDIVSGVVSTKQESDGVVAIDLTPAAEMPSVSITDGKKKKKYCGKPVTVRGVLPFRHMGDHASLCGETLAAALTPGTVIEELLVLEVNKMDVPTVSLKPLLLTAIRGHRRSEEEKEAFVPKSVSDVSCGDLVAGYVSKVESFGVFVRFLGRFSALCPRVMSADRLVEDLTGLFSEGDSVRWDYRYAVIV